MLSSGLRIPLLSPPLLLLLLLTAMELSWSFTEEEEKLMNQSRIFTDEESKLTVDLHNQYRSQVSPPAADMLKMSHLYQEVLLNDSPILYMFDQNLQDVAWKNPDKSWDPELAVFAKDYAEKCIWEHNKERGRRGENLFAMSGDLDVKMAMETWYNEYQYYNFTTLACEEDQMCGHYTQVVWAASERVGCGTKHCDILQVLNDTDLHLVVCNYEPPGNVKGYQPYKEGSPCSMCPDDYTCKNSLCESSADLEEASASLEPTGQEPTAILTTSPAPQVTTTGPAPTTSESPKSIVEAESALPTSEGSSSLEPSSFLDTQTPPELQRDSGGLDSSLGTTRAPLDSDLTLSSVSPETGTKQATYSEPPSPEGLITSKPSMNNFEQSVTTFAPTIVGPTLPSTPKPLPIPKQPSTLKPPSTPKRPSFLKPPSYPKAPSVPKAPSISKSPARHRLSAYAKAIKGRSNAIQSSAGAPTIEDLLLDAPRTDCVQPTSSKNSDFLPISSLSLLITAILLSFPS